MALHGHSAIQCFGKRHYQKLHFAMAVYDSAPNIQIPVSVYAYNCHRTSIL
jgi:hypothetical protein